MVYLGPADARGQRRGRAAALAPAGSDFARLIDADGNTQHEITVDRSEGNRLIKLIEAGEFPFDGTHAGFGPDLDWPALRLTDSPEFPLHRLA